MEYLGQAPRIHETAFIAPTATIIGDVAIGEKSSIWFGTVVRGDVNYIRIGARSNVQDVSMLHVTRDEWPLIIGDDVTIAHRVMLHGCTIKGRSLIAIGATILDGAVIEENTIVAAGALVTEGMVVPAGTIAMGAPAKVKRDLTEKELALVADLAGRYVKYRTNYMK